MGSPHSGSSDFATSTAAVRRLKREDCKRTKHDSAFSQWKILIGPSDWKNHCLGKEGAEKYRSQNLSNSVSCPGVYELAAIKLHPESDTKTRILGSTSVCPVYVGQSDNVRTRLQQYGRDGDHLENECSNDEFAICRSASRKGPGLFSEIFSRGYGIAYRWAPMENKKDAEFTEKQLLDKFDYAWNKDRNGMRRKDDILKLLDRHAKASQFSRLAKNLLSYDQKQVGIKIRACEPLSVKNGSNAENNFIFSKILRIRRVHPPVPFNNGNDCADICGVAIGHGSVCMMTPVTGRKRCAEHKGMRVNGYVSKLNMEGNMPSISASMGYDTSEQSANKNSAPICGVILENGSPCSSKPFQRNKRCSEHKGKRIPRSEPNFIREK